MRRHIANDSWPRQQRDGKSRTGQQATDEAADAAGACDHDGRYMVHGGSLRRVDRTSYLANDIRMRTKIHDAQRARM